MDKKSITVLTISFILLLSWPFVTKRFYSPGPATVDTNAVTIVTNVVGGTNVIVTNVVPPNPVIANVPTNRTEIPVRPSGPEQTLVLENDLARYTFTSHGGGLKLVELKKYPSAVPRGAAARAASSNELATLNSKAPLPALALVGGAAIEGDGNYALTQIPNGVRAALALPSGLVILKDFTLGTNYLLGVAVRFENRSAQALAVPAYGLTLGTATPMTPRDTGQASGASWFNGVKMEMAIGGQSFGCSPKAAVTETFVGGNNVFWATSFNQFFAFVAIPKEPAYQIQVKRVELPAPTPAEMEADPKIVTAPFGYQASLRYAGAVIAPNQAVEKNLNLYAGPKEYNTLRRLGNSLELVMNFGFWSWFAQVLLFSLNGLNSLGLNYGVAIIVITVIIKACFWPLTTASTRSMKRMAELQPQMKALQAKYKDDPKKMNMKLMEFMKENKVSPLGGCLPMVLQIPVFMGFFSMIQHAIELRGASFLWASDLTQADTVFFIPGIHFPVNPLPIMMAVTMLWQTRLTPPAPGMDPMQAKMMQYMPLMMVVFLYNYSAGLTLYWTVQNLLSILQMKVTRAKEAPKDAAPPRPARK